MNPGANEDGLGSGTAISLPAAHDDELGEAVARAQQGDEAAFAVAYRLVQPGLLGYLRGLVGDDAEDVASDAWLQIARDIGRFTGDGGGFRGWTATIARHRALDHVRRLRSRPRPGVIEQDVLDLPGPHSTQELALETISTERALELVRGLPRDQAEAVLLRVVVGLDGPAAARVLGKRPGAVRTATHRGLKRLARQLGLGPEGGQDVPDDAPRTLEGRHRPPQRRRPDRPVSRVGIADQSNSSGRNGQHAWVTG